MLDQIANDITRFRQEVAEFEPEIVTHRRILTGASAILNEDQHMLLKEKVASYFGIAPMEVVIVGSAKLGFSIANEKRYRIFQDGSDIDVAIASDVLFNQIWMQILQAYENRSPNWENANDYRRYLFAGWIRPDYFPPPTTFPLSREWFQFFRSLTQSDLFGRNKISGALYKSWYHLERYQLKAVGECRRLERGLP